MRDAPQCLLDSTGVSLATGGTNPGQSCRRCLGLDSAKTGPSSGRLAAGHLQGP